MKRLQIGKVLTDLRGVSKKKIEKVPQENGPDKIQPVDMTLKDLFLDTFEKAIDVSTKDSTVLWFKAGQPLVACEDEYLELEDAIFTKLKNAYLSPNALQGAFPWVKHHINLAFEEAEKSED